MDMSKIQRALGFMEGVCTGLKEKEAELIEEAINEIDCALEGDTGLRPAVREHTTTAENEELVERLYGYLRKLSHGNSLEIQMAEDCSRAASLIEQLMEQLKDCEYRAYAERP